MFDNSLDTGTYNNVAESKTEDACQTCPAGNYCLQAETKTTGTDKCSAGEETKAE